jgi:hypothetical protein
MQRPELKNPSPNNNNNKNPKKQTQIKKKKKTERVNRKDLNIVFLETSIKK